MHCLKVRSFALATYILGRGVEPIDAVLIDGQTVYRFPIEADPVMDEYAAAKARLEAIERTARPVAKADEVIR